jgi:hypothetical protein
MAGQPASGVPSPTRVSVLASTIATGNASGPCRTAGGPLSPQPAIAPLIASAVRPNPLPREPRSHRGRTILALPGRINLRANCRIVPFTARSKQPPRKLATVARRRRLRTLPCNEPTRVDRSGVPGPTRVPNCFAAVHVCALSERSIPTVKPDLIPFSGADTMPGLAYHAHSWIYGLVSGPHPELGQKMS